MGTHSRGWSRLAQRVPARVGACSGPVFPTCRSLRLRGSTAQHRHHHRHLCLSTSHIVHFGRRCNLAALGGGHANLFATRQANQCRSPLESHVVWSCVNRTWHGVVAEPVGTWAPFEHVCRHSVLIYRCLLFAFLLKQPLFGPENEPRQRLSILRSSFRPVSPPDRPHLSDVWRGLCGFCPTLQCPDNRSGTCFCSGSDDRSTSLSRIKPP